MTKEELEVKDFNEKYPVGTNVIVSRYLGCPESEKVVDVITHEAFISSNGTPKVHLKHKGRYFDISHVDEAKADQIMLCQIYINDDHYSESYLMRNVNTNSLQVIAEDIARDYCEPDDIESALSDGVKIVFENEKEEYLRKFHVSVEAILDYSARLITD